MFLIPIAVPSAELPDDPVPRSATLALAQDVHLAIGVAVENEKPLTVSELEDLLATVSTIISDLDDDGDPPQFAAVPLGQFTELNGYAERLLQARRDEEPKRMVDELWAVFRWAMHIKRTYADKEQPDG